MFYPTPKEIHMDVKVFGPNLHSQDKGDMHVHAADCGDCKHYGPGKRFGGEREGWQLSVDTVEEVTEAVYGPDEYLYDPATEIDQYTASFYWAPCTKSLPNREAAAR